MEKLSLAHRLLRGFIIACCLLFLWQMAVMIFAPPPYLLPSPLVIFHIFITKSPLLMAHAIITMLEILIGLILGTIFGVMMALVMVSYPRLSHWALPLLIGTQALPVFALAPLLTLWLGFGLASKIMMAALIIYFPIVSALYDGLQDTDQHHVNLARIMGANSRQLLFTIRLPTALPALAKGFKIAAVSAPIGAVVGEWVGASRGLGYLMLYANGRMQSDLMFAALFLLVIMGLCLYGMASVIGNWLNQIILK